MPCHTPYKLGFTSNIRRSSSIFHPSCLANTGALQPLPMVTVESQTITTGTTSVEVGEVGDEEAAARPPLSTSKIIETVPAPPRPSESVLEDIPIENVQYVASYNWAETEQPTIVVPGTSVFPPSFLERYITHSRRVPRPTQARQLCGPDARSHSPCNPTTAPIS